MSRQGKKITDLEWLEMQIKFLEGHHYYYTETAIDMRLERKKQNITELKLMKSEVLENL